MALAAVGLTLAGCGLSKTKSVVVNHTHTVTVTVTHTITTTPKPPADAAACSGGQLSGTFAGVPGSAGAGQIEYALTLTNTSQNPCFVSGIPQAQLLGSTGSSLPTHVVAGQPGTATAAKITLTPGASAVANARFSPDVSGQGDAHSGACQPKAHTLRVTPDGGGTVDAAVQPPTSVCEQGRLSFQLFSASS